MKTTNFILILFTTVLLSCDVAESVVTTAGACAEGIEPILPDKTLSDATRNVAYYNTIDVEIYNAPNPDYYISDIKLEGQLPDGIRYDIYTNASLSIILSGLPTPSGTFDFTFRVTVLPYQNAPRGICNSITSHSYSIIVN